MRHDEPHRYCGHYEAALKAGRDYYRNCTYGAIALCTLTSINMMGAPPIAAIIIGFVAVGVSHVTGATIENRAWVKAHERREEQERTNTT